MVNLISETSGRNRKHSQRKRKKISVWRTVMMLRCCLRLCPAEVVTSLKDGEALPPGGVARCLHKRAGHTHISDSSTAVPELLVSCFIRKILVFHFCPSTWPQSCLAMVNVFLLQNIVFVFIM